MIKNIFKKKRNKFFQKKFRKKLINKFKKCPIQKLDYKLCEACHILPYAKCSDKKDRFNENNGILLTPTLHKIFDKNYFTINEESCKIELLDKNILKDNLLISDIEKIVENGKYIKELDNIKSKEYLRKRNSNSKII